MIVNWNSGITNLVSIVRVIPSRWNIVAHIVVDRVEGIGEQRVKRVIGDNTRHTGRSVTRDISHNALTGAVQDVVSNVVSKQSTF